MRTLIAFVSAAALLTSPALANGRPQPMPEWAQKQFSQNENTNHNSATAVGKSQASAVATGGRGGNAHATGGNAFQDQTQSQGQRQSTRSNANNRNSVNVDASQDYEAAASSAIANPALTTSPCTKGFGFGVQTVGGGASIAMSSGDQWCRATYSCDALYDAYGPQAVAICYAHFSPEVNQTLRKLGYIN